MMEVGVKEDVELFPYLAINRRVITSRDCSPPSVAFTDRTKKVLGAVAYQENFRPEGQGSVASRKNLRHSMIKQTWSTPF